MNTERGPIMAQGNTAWYCMQHDTARRGIACSSAVSRVERRSGLKFTKHIKHACEGKLWGVFVNFLTNVVPGRSWFDLKMQTFQNLFYWLVSPDLLWYSEKNVMGWWDLTDDESTLVQVMVWCHQVLLEPMLTQIHFASLGYNELNTIHIQYIVILGA